MLTMMNIFKTDLELMFFCIGLGLSFGTLDQREMFTRIQVRPRREVQAVRMENWVCRRAAQDDCNTRS